MRLRDNKGQLAVVMILSIAALTSGLLIWRNMEVARSQYRRLRAQSELRIAAQIAFDATKAELMRAPATRQFLPTNSVSPGTHKLADFRNLTLDNLLYVASSNIVKSSTGQYEVNLKAVNSPSENDFSTPNWTSNLFGNAVIADSAGKLTITVQSTGPVLDNTYFRPINIKVTVDTKPGPGALPFREEINRNFSMIVATANLIGTVIANPDPSSKFIKMTGITASGVDPKQVLVGNAPGVVFDGKVFVNVASQQPVTLFDPTKISTDTLSSNGLIYNRTYTNGVAVSLPTGYNLASLKQIFLHGIEAHAFSNATEGFELLNGLFFDGTSSNIRGLNEKITYYQNNLKIFEGVPWHKSQTSPEEVRPNCTDTYTGQVWKFDEFLENRTGTGDDLLDVTCQTIHPTLGSPMPLAVAQNYNSTSPSTTTINFLQNSKWSKMVCGLIATNKLVINIPACSSGKPKTFAIIGNIIADSIEVKFGADTSCNPRLFIMNPFDNHSLPNDLAFPTQNPHSMPTLMGLIQGASGTISRRFTSPSLSVAGRASSDAIQRYVNVHGGTDTTGSSFDSYVTPTACSSGTNVGKFPMRQVTPPVPATYLSPYDLKAESAIYSDAFGFVLEDSQ